MGGEGQNRGGEGGGGAKKRKKPQKSRRYDVENGGDSGAEGEKNVDKALFIQ